MTWRTSVLLQAAPTAATVLTTSAGPGVFVSLVLVAGDLVRTFSDPTPNGADAAALAWVQSLGVAQVAPREVSSVRCGRNAQGAMVLYHFRNAIILSAGQVTALAQATPQTVFQAVNGFAAQLGPAFQTVLAEWQSDRTIRWDHVVGDAQHVLGVVGQYEPDNY